MHLDIAGQAVEPTTHGLARRETEEWSGPNEVCLAEVSLKTIPAEELDEGVAFFQSPARIPILKCILQLDVEELRE